METQKSVAQLKAKVGRNISLEGMLNKSSFDTRKKNVQNLRGSNKLNELIKTVVNSIMSVNSQKTSIKESLTWRLNSR